jgi:hypothetical protein
VLALWIVSWFAAVPQAQPPQAPPSVSARTWLGHEAQFEEHLKRADVTSLEDIGTGVTRPGARTSRRPSRSRAWPESAAAGKRGGYWESYKRRSPHELDKLLNMRMVPPAVERSISTRWRRHRVARWDPQRQADRRKVPSGEVWGKSIRKMLLFDNLIANADRNAGNILIGSPGELILIDHSRAFITDRRLPNKIERVDAELWERARTLTPEELTRALQP